MEGLPKVLSFALLIVLGYFLRRCNVLKEETIHALSGLLLYVTLPCLIAVSLNGLVFDSSMLGLVFFGFILNVILIGVATLCTRKSSERARQFQQLNLPGSNIGTFIMPYAQSFVTPTGFLALCMYDAGNAIMCTGGTYALLMGDRTQKPWRYIWNTLRTLFSSGPILSYTFMTALALCHVRLPDSVITFAQIPAGANAFLAMIMIGESINLKMSRQELFHLARLMILRLIAAIIFGLFCWYCLPYFYSKEICKALTIAMFAPLAAMSVIFTIKAKNDVKMAANLNSLSVAVSIVTVTTVITLLD